MLSFDKIYYNENDLTQYHIYGGETAKNEYRKYDNDSAEVLNYEGTFGIKTNNELITITDNAPGINLEQAKKQQKEYIKSNFFLAFESGYLSSSGIKVDCNRIDVQNMELLIEYMTDNDIASTQLRAYDNSFHSVTLSNLISLKKELIAYGLGLYQTKWQKEGLIDAATNLTTIRAITW